MPAGGDPAGIFSGTGRVGPPDQDDLERILLFELHIVLLAQEFTHPGARSRRYDRGVLVELFRRIIGNLFVFADDFAAFCQICDPLAIR